MNRNDDKPEKSRFFPRKMFNSTQQNGSSANIGCSATDMDRDHQSDDKPAKKHIEAPIQPHGNLINTKPT